MARKIKCLLVDDEPLAIRLLENHIHQFGNFEIVGTCSNAIRAMEILATTGVDLMFLDIKMPQLTGIEFLKGLKHPPAVIITTAYREFALEGYDLDVADYLLKPITFERFFKAVNRYLRLAAPALPTPAEDHFLFLRSGHKTHKINTSEILFAESMDDRLIIHLHARKLQLKYRISDLEAELPGNQFLRVHRSFIVNLQRVTAYANSSIEISGVEIPVGSSFRSQVGKALNFK